jgi:threonine/homoserine efflux transporter RhtA
VKHPIVNVVVVVGAVAALLAGFSVFPVLGAAAVCWLILRVGVLMLGGLARPIPEAPPAGELRKVKITYRCEICGTEVRMTVAPDADPDPPRHCQDDMTLMTPVE